MTYAIVFIVGVSVGAWFVSWWSSRSPRDDVSDLVQHYRDTHCMDCKATLATPFSGRCLDCADREHSWMGAIK